MSGLNKGGTVWVVQALSGGLLVVVLALHWTAQHLVVEGGLRGHAQVVAYLRQPGIIFLEGMFLIVVTLHALLGVRAILLDIGPARRVERWIDGILAASGIGIVVYGLQLVVQLAR